jgi:HK97 gp10 family phage protein
MSGTTVKLTNNIPGIMQKIRGNVTRGQHAMARDVASVAFQLCAVSDNNEPGHVHTRDTIAVLEDGEKTYVIVKGVGLLLEYGTVNMPAQAFMRPAFESVRAKHRSYFRKVAE